MKMNHFLIATVAALAMLSCSSEEKTPGQEEAGRSKLSIRILGEAEAPKGRAAGTADPTAESKINNFILFVFKEGGANDVAPKEYTSTPTEAVSREITTDAKEVYVIANTRIAGETQSAMHAALLNVKSKTELQAVIGRGFTAADANDAPATQTNVNLWMSGTNDAPFTPLKEGNVAIAVTMHYVAAKVYISKVTMDTELAKELFLNSVIVFNAGAATSFIPADGKSSLIPSYEPAPGETPFYTSGVSMKDFTNKPILMGINNEYSYKLEGSGIKQISATENQHYFYVFENDGVAFNAQPTIVTLKCINGSSEPFYYSVFFKKNTGNDGYDDKVIERGNIYNITMDIKKKGPADPTIPALKTTVEVTITPAKWKTITIDKVYE